MASLPTNAYSPGLGHLHNALARHLENPFLVLDLPVTVGAGELERQGQKWMAMLAAGLDQAKHYTTPFGPRARTADLVRTAMAELRDPGRRLIHEFWATGWGKVT